MKTTWITANGKGWVRVAHKGRRYEVARSGNGWEVAIWWRDSCGYMLSTGETPEGVFKTRADALEALWCMLAKRAQAGGAA